MHVLAIYRHFWPDVTPYARTLRTIAEDLVAHGHDATVFTAQPSYNDVRMPAQPRREVIGGVSVFRARLPREQKSWTAVRAFNAVAFLAQAVIHAVRHKKDYDALIFNVHPPVLMGLAARIIKRLTGIPYIAHVQDIHPDAAELAGRLKNARLIGLLQRIDTRTGRGAACNVVLSGDMRDTLVARGIDPERVEVLNNFALDRYTDTASALPAPLDRDDDIYTVLFAGNLGDYQLLDCVVDAALALRSNRLIRFVLMGSGAARARLVERAREVVDRTLFFVTQQSVEVAFAAMRRADLGVVSLLPGVYRVAYPSKTMMYLAAGCPLLAMVEPESTLARQVDEHRLGYLASQDDAGAVADTITAAAESGRWSVAERARLVETGATLFDRERALARWRALIDSVAHP